MARHRSLDFQPAAPSEGVTIAPSQVVCNPSGTPLPSASRKPIRPSRPKGIQWGFLNRVCYATALDRVAELFVSPGLQLASPGEAPNRSNHPRDFALAELAVVLGRSG